LEFNPNKKSLTGNYDSIGVRDGKAYIAPPIDIAVEWVQALNPEPPYKWYPFEPYRVMSLDDSRKASIFATRQLDAARYQNRFFRYHLPQGDLLCLSRVIDFKVNISGPIEGGLEFNQGKRMKGVKVAALNGNKMLGGTRKSKMFIESQFFKYEVVVKFDNPREGGFYGQMISVDPVKPGTVNPQIIFKDDSPANDWNGCNWDLGPGEKKEDYPIFEVETGTGVGAPTTIRWIDSPQAKNIPNTFGTKYVWVYAGACGLVTHAQILQITYTPGIAPIATKITEAQFQAAVGSGSWSFAPP